MDEGTLHAYLDEELSPAEVASARAHLAACAACRASLDQARQVRERAHAILRMADPPAVVTPDFATLAAHHHRSTQAADPPRRSRALLLPWAASIALALGAGWFAQTLIRGSATGGETAMVTMQAERAGTTAESLDDARFDAAAPPSQEAAGGVSAAKTGAEAVTEDAAPSPASVMAARSAETAADGPMAADARSIPPSASPQPSPEGYAAADARPTVERRRTDATGGIEEAGIAAPPRMQTAQAAPAVGDQGPPADGGGAVAARALVSAGVEAEAAPAAPPPPTPAISNNPRWPDQWLTVERDSAMAVLGQPAVQVEDLPVVAYQIGVGTERPTIRVVQRLPGGQTVEVRQRLLAPGQAVRQRITAPVESRVLGVVAADSTTTGQERGGLEIRMEAAISTDSLRRLMESLR